MLLKYFTIHINKDFYTYAFFVINYLEYDVAFNNRKAISEERIHVQKIIKVLHDIMHIFFFNSGTY